MLTAALTVLYTPIFDYAAARLVGASLLFVAGPTLTFQQQQMQGTLPSLGQRQFKLLQLSLGVAGIFFAWAVPFTTTLPLALTYALFLFISGMAGMGNLLRRDPNWETINITILQIDPEMRAHLGIYPNMGYVAINEVPESPSDGLAPTRKDFSVFSLPTLEQAPQGSAILEALNASNLLPDDRGMIVHIDGGANFFIKPVGTTLPERLPQPHEISKEDLEASRENYEALCGLDLSFLVGKSVQEIDDLGRLIIEYESRLSATRHEIGIPLWRFLCEKHLPYADEATHPFIPRIVIKKKTA